MHASQPFAILALLSTMLAGAAAQAEKRTVTVTNNSERAITYFGRSYICASVDGTMTSGPHAVIPPNWTIAAGATATMEFDVPCPDGQRVITVGAIYKWDSQDSFDGLFRSNPPGALGSVNTHLLCNGQTQQPAGPPAPFIYTCALGDDQITACFTPMNVNCECSDANPPIEGVDYFIGGIENDRCSLDLNGNGEVGPDDLAILLGGWGPCPPGDCFADLNHDGFVNAADLALILGGWGGC